MGQAARSISCSFLRCLSVFVACKSVGLALQVTPLSCTLVFLTCEHFFSFAHRRYRIHVLTLDSDFPAGFWLVSSILWSSILSGLCGTVVLFLLTCCSWCYFFYVQDTIEQYLAGWNDEEEDEEFSTPIDDVSLKIFFYEVIVKTIYYLKREGGGDAVVSEQFQLCTQLTFKNESSSNWSCVRGLRAIASAAHFASVMGFAQMSTRTTRGLRGWV